VKISSIKADITTVESEALIVNLFEDVKIPGGATGSVDSYLGGKISKLITAGEITGKKNEITIIHTFEEFSFQRVIICGLGKQEKFNYDSIRQIMAITLRYLRKIKVKKVTSICHGAGIGGLDPQLCTLAMKIIS
jgi:leucyl aminopeptidase